MGKSLRRITHRYVYADDIEKDFSFIIRGNSYSIGLMNTTAVQPDFLVDWGDGTETVVSDADIASRSHVYSTEQEWIVTIKHFVSGWFYFSGDKKVIRILTPIPNQENREAFNSCFNGCSNLISITPKLFKNCPDAVQLNNCFSGCTSLTFIPDGLFDYCSKAFNFYSCFEGCKSLTVIPDGLFKIFSAVNSFAYCFANCTGLISIPERLFSNCINIIYMYSCFMNCSGLISIPMELFVNNLLITDFSTCFYGCTSLTGEAPAIWLRSNASGGMCFTGCTGLSNYNEIPPWWGGAY